MPVYVLNTCGTSLLTNGINNEFRQLLIKYSNMRQWDEMLPIDADRIKAHITERKALLLAADEPQIRKMSAELNGLFAWQQQQQDDVSQHHYALLATDTIIGNNSADIIKALLQKWGYQSNIITATGLNTSSLLDFREALSGLVKTLVETLEGYQRSQYRICFNLTGGFKSLNGFLQAISTIYADETFYLFEGSKDVMFIPKLPFILDAKQVIENDLAAFRRLAHNLPIAEIDHDIADSLLFRIDDKVMLSEWGELLWTKSCPAIYQQRLLPSISPRVIFEEGFASSTKHLPSDVLAIVNKRIAQLAEYAEGDCQHLLASLDAKPLQAKHYKARNLWECDVDDHHRIFMVKDGYNFFLEKVAPSLH